MKSSIKIYIGILVLLVIGAAYLELSKPKPIDWRQTYNERHTKPYGLKVFREQLATLRDSVKDITVSPYEYLNPLYSYLDDDYSRKGTFVMVNAYYDWDEVSTQELLDYVSYGNKAFLSSASFPEILSDSLKFKYRYGLTYATTGTLSLSSPSLQKDSISLKKGFEHIYFTELDETNTTVLGYVEVNGETHVNFAKMDYGDGAFYIHLQPVAFTNYHLLKEDHYQYAEATLSYLPQEMLFFDSRNKIGGDLGSSPLRYLFSQPALKWAWRLGLVSLLLFFIFNAKRRQRIIKVIEPLQNTTVAFIKTIGNLYFQTEDHNNLVQKKVTYFLERVRNDLYLDTATLDEKFAKKLSKKWGYSEEKTQKLVKLIRYVQNKRVNTEGDLINLNKAIEAFYLKQ